MKMRPAEFALVVELLIAGALCIFAAAYVATRPRQSPVSDADHAIAESKLATTNAHIASVQRLSDQHDFDLACYCMLLAAAKNPDLRATNAEASVNAAREEYRILFPKDPLFSQTASTNTP